MILEDFDKNKVALINPCDTKNRIEGFPKKGISCFSRTLIEKLVELLNPTIIAYVSNAASHLPIYEASYNGEDIVFYLSPVGAPACIGAYEEVLALGLDNLVMFGTCGVLDRNIRDCSIIIPNKAIRDEGTSYHYLESSEEVTCNEFGIQEFVSILEKHNYSYTIGKCWTTDAFYRETSYKMNKRKEAGAICVDMEASAMSAVAKFRGKRLFHFFYAADNLDGSKWEERSLSNSALVDEKVKIAFLAVEMSLKMGR